MTSLSARKCLENRANMEDDRVGILETQLAQAKHIAEEADKKYEEVRLCTTLTTPSSIYPTRPCHHHHHYHHHVSAGMVVVVVW